MNSAYASSSIPVTALDSPSQASRIVIVTPRM